MGAARLSWACRYRLVALITNHEQCSACAGESAEDWCTAVDTLHWIEWFLMKLYWTMPCALAVPNA